MNGHFISDNGISDKVFVVDHHEAHAFSAFSFSPFDDALVVTADGRGDFISLTVSFITSTGAHEILYRATSADSLGFFMVGLHHCWVFVRIVMKVRFLDSLHTETLNIY